MHIRTGFSCFFLCLAVISLILCAGCTNQAGPAQASATAPSLPAATQVTPGPASRMTYQRLPVSRSPQLWHTGVKVRLTMASPFIRHYSMPAARKVQWYRCDPQGRHRNIHDRFRFETEAGERTESIRGSGTIANWTDGDAYKGGGIRIPFNQINVPSTDNRFGYTYATVHLPDGRTLTGQFNATQLIQPALYLTMVVPSFPGAWHKWCPYGSTAATGRPIQRQKKMNIFLW